MFLSLDGIDLTPKRGTVAYKAARALAASDVPEFIGRVYYKVKNDNPSSWPIKIADDDETVDKPKPATESAENKAAEVAPPRPQYPVRRYESPKPDATVEDAASLFSKQAIMSTWKTKRTAFIATLTALSIDHLALSSALDVLEEQIPILTNNAASLSTKDLKTSSDHVFKVAYLERVGAMLNIPRPTLDHIVKNHAERIWGAKPQAPVVVHATQERSLRRYGGEAEESAPRNQGPVGYSTSRPSLPPISPFGV